MPSMPFSKPKDPRQAVVQFLEKRVGQTKILGPVGFRDTFPQVLPYKKQLSGQLFDWAILHKGQLKKLDVLLLLEIAAQFLPVFANEVFVVWVRQGIARPQPRPLPYNSPHLIAFREQLAAAATQQWPQAAAKGTPERQLRRAQSVYLGNGQALTHTTWGRKLIVNTEDISLSPHLLSDGHWEPWVTRAFRQVIRRGMTVVDVGANIGYYAVLAGDLVGPSGHVYAFEASPSLHDVLWKNANINGMSDRTTTINKAVFEKAQTLQFSQMRAFQGSGSVQAQGRLDEAGQQQQRDLIRDRYQDEVVFYDVEAVSLDNYFPGDVTVDLIKIDAEGSEPFIFKGMRQLIARQSQLRIIFEFYPHLFEGANQDPRQFLEDLQQNGFTLQAISHKQGLVAASMEQLLSGEFQELYITKGL